MPIGLIFYIAGDRRVAVEASKVAGFVELENGNAAIVCDGRAAEVTDTPYQQLVDDYTYRVAVSRQAKEEEVIKITTSIVPDPIMDRLQLLEGVADLQMDEEGRAHAEAMRSRHAAKL